MMQETSLGALAAKLDRLIQQYEQLARENRALREKELNWMKERNRLMEKNELARSRVEAMITRLKSLEAEV